MAKPANTHSIAEWYGHDFTSLSTGEIRKFAAISQPKVVDCPFSKGSCNKKGGVCSIRSYSSNDGASGNWVANGDPIATCPRRFEEGDTVISWVGEQLIDEPNPKVVTEVPFLSGVAHDGTATGSTVGKIDMVLVGHEEDRMKWCAVEIQSVYFSGAQMGKEFTYLKTWNGTGIPTPQGRRHPDFRSSGPKRLMPQLQTKVPTISRWGRKMAVVIDLGFWESLSPMEEVNDVSNCDVAWFVVKFEQNENRFKLVRKSVHFTTLIRAVEGLIAGEPIPLEKFESELGQKLKP